MQLQNAAPARPDLSLVEIADQMRTQLRNQSEANEKARRVDGGTIRQLAQAGVFRMLVPEALGGHQVEPVEFVQVLEALGRGDAATGWCAMTGSTTGLLSAYMHEGGSRLWTERPNVVMAGVFAPMGRATPVDGGYRVSGRWPFASGCQNADFWMGGALVMGESGPRMLDDGQPEILSVFFEPAQAERHDTWHTVGLNGTGSHDIEIKDVVIPAERTASVFGRQPTPDDPLYAFPLFGLLAAGIAAVGLGMGRAAIEDFLDELNAKRVRPGQRPPKEQGHIQTAIAAAEGELRAGRSLLLSICSDLFAKAARTGLVAPADRALLRVAATQAATATRRVIDSLYELGGGATIYERSRLSRHFRDVHTLSHHVMVQPASLQLAGSILTGAKTAARQL